MTFKCLVEKGELEELIQNSVNPQTQKRRKIVIWTSLILGIVLGITLIVLYFTLATPRIYGLTQVECHDGKCLVNGFYRKCQYCQKNCYSFYHDPPSCQNIAPSLFFLIIIPLGAFFIITFVLSIIACLIVCIPSSLLRCWDLINSIRD